MADSYIRRWASGQPEVKICLPLPIQVCRQRFDAFKLTTNKLADIDTVREERTGQLHYHRAKEIRTDPGRYLACDT
jgi:hypothetical protein